MAEAQEKRADETACGVRHAAEFNIHGDPIALGKRVDQAGVQGRIQRKNAPKHQ